MALTMAIERPVHRSDTCETSFWLTAESDATLLVGTFMLQYTKYSVQVIPVEQAMEQLEKQKELLQDDEGLQEMLSKGSSQTDELPLPEALQRAYPDGETMTAYASKMSQKINPIEVFDREKFLEVSRSIEDMPPALFVPKVVANQAIPVSLPKGKARYRFVRRFLEPVDPWDVMTVQFVDSQGSLQGGREVALREPQISPVEA